MRPAVTVTSREPTTVSLTLHGRHRNEVVTSNGGALASSHSINLLGLYPDSRNELTIRAETADGDVYERQRTVETAPLPDYFPDVEIVRHAPDSYRGYRVYRSMRMPLYPAMTPE